MSFSSDIYKRFFSALVIGSVFTISMMNPYVFALLMFITLAGMIYEWYDLSPNELVKYSVGLLIILSVSIIILYRFYFDDYRPVLIFFFCIWMNDTFAMIAGKTIAGPKIAPTISPNKTWSGFFGGIIASGCTAIYLSYVLSCDIYEDYKFWGVYGVVLAIVGFLSDIFISFFKRKANIKDTGNIIPGHGGVLDRFDSTILTAFISLTQLH
jgi:phosphatidate cytidylyltransferase